MSMSSEWALTLPFEGGFISLTAKIPDVESASAEDVDFTNSLREQMLDRMGQVLAERATRLESTAKEGQEVGG